MLKIVSYVAKFGMAAAKKKFGSAEVKQAAEVIKSTGLKRGKTSKAAVTSKRGPKKTPSKPSPRSAATKGTGKPKRPSEKATKTPGKPKTKSKGIGDFLGEMFGRKRTGKTPKRSDSQAYRDGLKAGQKKADEKLNPSLRNKDMKPRSISNRRSDVAEQLRDIKKAGGSPKDVARLEARLRNLKDMAKDRPDLTTMRGKFKDGGSVIDLRKSGLFTKTTNNLKTSPRPVGRNDAAEAKAVEGGNRESARVAREDPMYLRPKARKNKK